MGTEVTDSGHAGVVELEFALDDPDYPFVGASLAESCRLELEDIVPRGDGGYAEFFGVYDGDPDRVATLAGEHEFVDSRVLQRYDDGGLLEFVVTGDCPSVTLADLGALTREAVGDRGEGRIVAEVLTEVEPREVVDGFFEEFPAAELVARRERPSQTPLFGDREFRETVVRELTDRQHEIVRAAFEAGYYEWPRECTGQELAAELGISRPTLSKHLYAAERNILTVLFGSR